MNMLKPLLALCLALGLIIMPGKASGAPDVPEVMGVVTASGSNEKLSGVEIRFEGTRGGRLVLIGSATSREDGSYYLRDEGFLGFGGDTIRVTASLSGYKTWSGDVTLDGTVTLNIELTPASNDQC